MTLAIRALSLSLGLSFASGVALITGTAAAHDFWLVPQSFEIAEPGEIEMRFKVGHAAEVNNWNLTWDRVVALRAHGPNGATDLSPYLTPVRGLVPGAVKAPLSAPGTYVVGFESNHSFSDLEASKFNDYAAEEGLTAIIEAREKAGTAEQNGRELYARRAKVLLQVGDQTTDSATMPLGHTLEIVPEVNPYALAEDRRLPIRVMFRGAPVARVQIEITSLGTGEEAFAKVLTDDEGRASFDVPEGGAYRINTVWGVPNANANLAEFETMFASLTFGG